jgi:hypothetical protein
LRIDGNFTQTDDALLSFGIDGLNPGTNYMQISVSSNALLAGVLRCRFVNGFAPKSGDILNLLNIAGETSGSFSSVELQNLAPGFQFNLVTTNGKVSMVALNDAVFVPPLRKGIQASLITKGGITYLPYILPLDNPCRQYQPSVPPVRNATEILQVLSESFLRTDCSNSPALLTNTLVLGALPPGNYNVRFLADGITVQTVSINVPAETGQLLHAELASSKTALDLTVNGLPGISYSILASTDLIHWMPIFTQTASFIHIVTMHSRSQFYRVQIAID